MNKTETLLSILLAPFQRLENAQVQVRDGFDPRTAVGVQLDILGKLVDQKRLGLTDDVYRRYILAKIATHRSSGKREELLNIARLVINDDTALIVMQQQSVATVYVRVDVFVPDEPTRVALILFLQLAAANGVRVLLDTLEAPEARTFKYSRSAFVSSAILAGVTVIPVFSTTGFPPSGTIKVAANDTGLEETMDYNSIDATHFYLPDPTTFAHAQNTDVQLYVITGTPGFGKAAFTTPASISAGSGTITVGSTTGFPSSGSIQVDGGTSASETLVYTSKSSTVFTLSGVTAFAHTLGAAVVDATSATDPATGGIYRDVREMTNV